MSLSTLFSRDLQSAFFPEALLRQARRPTPERDRLIAAAAPWHTLSDDTLWEWMFGNTIKRSWMVWSNGFCPSCKKPVPMYTWVPDALKRPWTMQCPHCQELFPKNDFAAYYTSGLDERRVFDPSRADRKLLFNRDHPDPSDPLHRFGVDDGEGYVDGMNRWRFIGAYLIFGQWKQAILGGIDRLSAAYAVTGDPVYARKTTILLDRVADLYPSHDFGQQGVMYEGPPRSGYVSTWHDACMETRAMAIAWDLVRSAVADDQELTAFLNAKAKRWKVDRPKETPADIARNIAGAILRHPRDHQDRIYCNYPQTELTVAILETVERGSLAGAEAAFDPILPKMTAVDGLTGEKGLTGYSVFATQHLANVIALYTRAEPTFLSRLLARHPRLARTYRFHIDTWCDSLFYPRIGDCGAVGYPDRTYSAVAFSQNPGIQPSMYAFMLQLSEKTGDPGFVQALWQAAEGKAERIACDLFEASPDAIRRRAAALIKRHGPDPKVSSLDAKEWHLALLRGSSEDARPTLWIDYDSGGYHAHADGGNIGLFAHGLDLLPDFGYPPVQFGGWDSKKARWYLRTSAHNTVTIDGRNQRSLAGPMTERPGYEGLPAGRTTLWEVRRDIQAVRVDGRGFDPTAERYERTLVLIRTGRDTFCVVDVFRVRGGSDHARFLHGPPGQFEANGLRLMPAPDYGFDAELRAFRTDPAPTAGWSAVWTPDDRHKTRRTGAPVRMRLTDFSTGASASLCEAWVAGEGISSPTETWIPSVMVRKQGGASLVSTFVSVLDVHRGDPGVRQIRRLKLASDTEALLSWERTDGGNDLIWLRDPESSGRENTLEDGRRLTTDGDIVVLRRDRTGRESAFVAGGTKAHLNGRAVQKEK